MVLIEAHNLRLMASSSSEEQHQEQLQSQPQAQSVKECLHKTKSLSVLSLASVSFSCASLCSHIPLCWALVFKFGLQHLGAAFAIGISYWVNVVLLILYMMFTPCASTRVPISFEIFQGIGEFLWFTIPSAELYEVLAAAAVAAAFESSLLHVISFKDALLIYFIFLKKFLELSFSNHAAASRVASCGHSLHRDCLRFYRFGKMVACFQYASIDVLSVFLPPPKLDFSLDNREWIQKEIDEVVNRVELLFSEVLNALRQIMEKRSGAGGEAKSNNISESLQLTGLKLDDVEHVGNDRRNDIWGAKDAGKLKSSFVVIIKTRETLNNILPPPMDFDPKRPRPNDISMKFFDYLTSDMDEVIDYNICEVFMPLNIKDTHWVLAKIDLPNRHVFIYDSTLTKFTNRDQFKPLWIMLPYILRQPNFFLARSDVKGVLNQFAHSYVENFPTQGNGVDCGVFMLKAMQYLLAKLEFNFSHGDIEFFRQKYAIELYNKELPT
ncbi:hypothetical protein FNV43_RR02111 [Rhamnella rubrinervis]|uniref:Ubiquitin-like protease family profile domain-containing protein n=1 Tax=Rhamnella rubrinervis TaxID=2594499 RepID=A0A8K0HTB9_9ROSA|nr:hypothetical protein FNV43_RR02111 [Rhamnella rubrinervis]